jgi:hypothetical protein
MKMAKLFIALTYKNACILKHALRDKIEGKEGALFLDGLTSVGNYTEEEKTRISKELEEEKRALEEMTEEINGYKDRWSK